MSIVMTFSLPFFSLLEIFLPPPPAALPIMAPKIPADTSRITRFSMNAVIRGVKRLAMPEIDVKFGEEDESPEPVVTPENRGSNSDTSALITGAVRTWLSDDPGGGGGKADNEKLVVLDSIVPEDPFKREPSINENMRRMKKPSVRKKREDAAPTDLRPRLLPRATTRPTIIHTIMRTVNCKGFPKNRKRNPKNITIL